MKLHIVDDHSWRAMGILCDGLFCVGSQAILARRLNRPTKQHFAIETNTLSYIEGQLPSGDYLLTAFSIADLTLVTPFANASYASEGVCTDTYPKFAALVKDVRGEPAVATVLEKEAEAMGPG